MTVYLWELGLWADNVLRKYCMHYYARMQDQWLMTSPTGTWQSLGLGYRWVLSGRLGPRHSKSIQDSVLQKEPPHRTPYSVSVQFSVPYQYRITLNSENKTAYLYSRLNSPWYSTEVVSIDLDLPLLYQQVLNGLRVWLTMTASMTLMVFNISEKYTRYTRDQRITLMRPIIHDNFDRREKYARWLEVLVNLVLYL